MTPEEFERIIDDRLERHNRPITQANARKVGWDRVTGLVLTFIFLSSGLLAGYVFVTKPEAAAAEVKVRSDTHGTYETKLHAKESHDRLEKSDDEIKQGLGSKLDAIQKMVYENAIMNGVPRRRLIKPGQD